jgi:hypothetical protein
MLQWKTIMQVELESIHKNAVYSDAIVVVLLFNGKNNFKLWFSFFYVTLHLKHVKYDVGMMVELQNSSAYVGCCTLWSFLSKSESVHTCVHTHTPLFGEYTSLIDIVNFQIISSKKFLWRVKTTSFHFIKSTLSFVIN